MVQWWRVAVEGAWRVAFMHSSITMQISQVLLWHNTWTPYFLPYFLPCHSHVYTQCQSIASQNIRCLGHNDTFNRLHQIPSKCAYISIVTFETFATHSTRHFHTSPLSNWLPFGSDMGGTWIVYISFRFRYTKHRLYHIWRHLDDGYIPKYIQKEHTNPNIKKLKK